MKEHMNKRFNITLILMALILTGCATPNLDGNYTLKKSADRGVVIASLTKTGHGHWPPGYNFKKTDGSHKGILKFEQDLFDRIVSDYPGIEGKLIALELPAGDYHVYRWFISQGHIGLESRDGFNINFTVASGEVTYIGELNNDRDAGGLFGAGLGRISFKVKDSGVRDLREVTRRYPKLDIAGVKANLMEITNLGNN